jgi:hypothetical protein
MAVVEARVTALGDEQRRTRDRLHDIESDRAAVSLLAQRVEALSGDVRELSGQVEKVAERAAREAVRLAFDQWEDEREDSSFKVWATRLTLGMLAVAAGGFLLALIQALTSGTQLPSG